MSLKEQLAEYRAGWYQRVPAERQAIMQRHIDELRSGTIARTMLKVGDHAPAMYWRTPRERSSTLARCLERSRHRHLLSRWLVPLLQPRTEGISGHPTGDHGGRGFAGCDQPGEARRHSVDRREERAHLRSPQ